MGNAYILRFIYDCKIKRRLLALCEMPRYFAEQTRVCNQIKVLHPDDKEKAYDRINHAIKEKHPLFSEYRIVLQDGRIHWISARGDTSYDNSGKPLSMTGICIDITERKQAELALMESENKFKSFAEQSFVGMYLIQDGVFRYVNPRFAEIFGYNVEECSNMQFQNLVFPEDLEIVEKQVKRRILGEVAYVKYKFRGIKKNREVVHVEVYGSTVSLRGKRIIWDEEEKCFFIFNYIDGTEQALTESQLMDKS